MRVRIYYLYIYDDDDDDYRQTILFLSQVFNRQKKINNMKVRDEQNKKNIFDQY